ncbi:MAG: hypothetical protein MHPSP_004628 [Paramarteilia canceri]
MLITCLVRKKNSKVVRINPKTRSFRSSIRTVKPQNYYRSDRSERGSVLDGESVNNSLARQPVSLVDIGRVGNFPSRSINDHRETAV